MFGRAVSVGPETDCGAEKKKPDEDDANVRLKDLD
jgi:hypothetical protein